MNLSDRVKNFLSNQFHIWNVNLPDIDESSNENTRFVIVTPFRNIENFIAINAYVSLNQKYSNFKVIFIDDCSCDSSNLMLNTVLEEGNFENCSVITNQERKYALENIVNAIQNSDINDEDVVILVDGDDWFSSPNVLNHLDHVYSNYDCVSTYGSYSYFANGLYRRMGVEPSEYPQDVIKNNSFRQDRWRASHLRTFKFHIWKEIALFDLMVHGSYFKYAYDQAIMLPVLEISGSRSKYIDKNLYVYNKLGDNVDKTHAVEQTNLANIIRSRKPYEPLY